MTLKDELLAEIEETRERFLKFLDSIPESEYTRQSGNAAWTVGDVLYHVTLGPRAIVFEAWMMIHVRGLYQFGMRHFPSEQFNRINAKFARRDARQLSRAGLAKAYQNAHTALRSALRRVREQDFARSVIYPANLEPMIAGEVSVERLFRYAKAHFEAHAEQIGWR
jgi:uncharacterized damage-inducible protein DinB